MNNCPNCGRPCADNAVFCPACGTRLAPPPQPAQTQQPVYQQPYQPQYQQPVYSQPQSYQPYPQPAQQAAAAAKKSHAGLIFLITLILLGGIGVGAYFLFFRTPTYKKALDDLAKFYETGETKYISQITSDAAKEYIEQIDEHEGSGHSFDELSEELGEKLLSGMADEFGEGYTVSYVIKKDKELSDKDLKNEKQIYKDEDIKPENITEGRSVKAELVFVGDEGEGSADIQIDLYFSDGKWYIGWDTIEAIEHLHLN